MAYNCRHKAILLYMTKTGVIMKNPIRRLFEIRHSMNVWLWRKGLATRKQKYQNYNHLPVEKAVIPFRGRTWLVIGICIGLIPYIVHQAPYIIKWVYA